MAKKEKKIGYSEALGGYGVPSQVEITGGQAADATSRKGIDAIFRLKPKQKIILAAIAAAVVVAILVATGVFGGGMYASSISSIEKTTQFSNGVSVTNYMPILAENVDWAGLSSGKREGIAKYAVKEALKRVETDQATIFNIVGLPYDRSGSIFLYLPESGDGNGGSVQISVNGQLENTVKVK